MDNKSQSQFAVVTGGSSGIGLELARVFLESGFDTLIVAQDRSHLRVAALELTNGATGRVSTFAADLSTTEGVRSLYSKLQQEGRFVDAIAINAGVGLGGSFLENSFDDELLLINLNVVSAVHLAKLVGKDMASRGSGRILFTASVASLMPSPFEAVYGATKAFILSFSESLRNELADVGVTVTALLPGPTETNLFHRAGMENTPVGQSAKDDPAHVAREGFEALMQNQHKVIAGSLKTKALGALAEVLPSAMSAAQHRKMSEPEDRR